MDVQAVTVEILDARGSVTLDGNKPNYIDALAHRIASQCKQGFADEPELWRIYAVLLLAKAPHVTSEDVHDAWSAWRAGTYPAHRSLVPFADLSPEVQALDDQYRDAINAVFCQTTSRLW